MSEKPRRTGWYRFSPVRVVIIAVAVVVAFWLTARPRSNGLRCLADLQHVATTFRVYGSTLAGFPFASSSDALQAMIEAGLAQPGNTRSRRSGQEFVIRYPSGLPSSLSDHSVVASEPWVDGLDCACVVFADGHGECVSSEEYRQIIGAVDRPTILP